mgnify:CR=1 FL=1
MEENGSDPCVRISDLYYKEVYKSISSKDDQKIIEDFIWENHRSEKYINFFACIYHFNTGSQVINFFSFINSLQEFINSNKEDSLAPKKQAKYEWLEKEIKSNIEYFKLNLD